MSNTPPQAVAISELLALRIQEWLYHEHDVVVSVQDLNKAANMRLLCTITEDSFTNAATLATPARVVSDAEIWKMLRAFQEYPEDNGFKAMRAALSTLTAGDAGVGERARWFKRAGDYLIRAQKAEDLLMRSRELMLESQENEGRHSEMKALIAAIDTALQPGQEAGK